MRLLMKSAAISLPLRGSAANDVARSLATRASELLEVDAGRGSLGAVEEGCPDRLASRWTVLRLTWTSASANAARIASHV